MFSKILIANRGEIACRVARTARRMGIATVAVYSDADAGALHVTQCDEAVRIGPAPARESYLRIDAILDAARASGAQAIHPGYGFLSENAEFAEACARAGFTFIGPPASAIRAMGNKSAAKELMQQAGVPLTPGYHGKSQEDAFLEREAAGIGYPVLIKASAGGGGKGMRVVTEAGEFIAALASCRREARSSFGDESVLLERYVERARHIEVQVFADTHGHCIHLNERDCSMQRRHQKVIEEAPAPGMTAERRSRMGQAAIAAARAVGYVGAGTVEFLVAPDGAFFFMEMNTRLQVEHPVTEMITGLDLVEWQLRIAAGEALPLAQEQVCNDGHAIEARIYAEDPATGFLPSTGLLAHLSMPAASRNVRVDTGVAQGREITAWYDPMIAKLIVWDATRERALAQMVRALASAQIVGVANNVAFLSRLVRSAGFAQAQLDTHYIERQGDALTADPEPPPSAFVIGALAALLMEVEASRRRAAKQGARWSPWDALGGWRLSGNEARPIDFRIGGARRLVIVYSEAGGYRVEIDGRTFRASGDLDEAGRLNARVDGEGVHACVVREGATLHVFLDAGAHRLTLHDPLAGEEHALDADGALLAPMPGRIVAVLAEAGTRVEKGAPLLVLEAMKMEHTLRAPSSGTVKAQRYAVGDQVALGAQLVEFEAATA